MARDHAKLSILFVNTVPNHAHMKDMSNLFNMSFIGPLTEIRQADFDVLWLGPWLVEDQLPLDWYLLEKCLSYKPDIIFINGWWWKPDDEFKKTQLSFAGIYLIRKLLGIKFTIVLFDQAPHQFEISDRMVNFCDVVFTHESKAFVQKYSRYPERHMVTTATFSPRLFHGDARSERPIDIAFVGGVGGYPDERNQGIAALRASGLEVTTPGGRGTGQKRLTNEEYAACFKQAKIALCWSRHISNKWFQAKARIFEATLGGALLLCEACEPVDYWFQPNVDYVPFSTPEELVAKAKHYLENEDERLKIAKQGNEKALREYSADVMWGKMIEAMKEDHYDESAAVACLRQNASQNELFVAEYLSKELKKRNLFDAKVIDQAVKIVYDAHYSVLVKIRWNGWYLASLRFRFKRLMIYLRWLLYYTIRKVGSFILKHQFLRQR